MAERDVFQIESEKKLELGNRFEIPPKTLPGDVDIEPMHDRHGRLVLLRRRITDIQYSINKTDERKRLAEGQMLTLAKKIAVGKDKSKQQEAELKLVNGPIGMLPMVIGNTTHPLNAPSRTHLPNAAYPISAAYPLTYLISIPYQLTLSTQPPNKHPNTFIYSFSHSLTPSFIRSLIHSFTPLFVDVCYGDRSLSAAGARARRPLGQPPAVPPSSDHTVSVHR